MLGGAGGTPARGQFLEHLELAAAAVCGAALGFGLFVLLLTAECTEYFNRAKALKNHLPPQLDKLAEELKARKKPWLANLLKREKFHRKHRARVAEDARRFSRARTKRARRECNVSSRRSSGLDEKMMAMSRRPSGTICFRRSFGRTS